MSNKNKLRVIVVVALCVLFVQATTSVPTPPKVGMVASIEPTENKVEEVEEPVKAPANPKQGDPAPVASPQPAATPKAPAPKPITQPGDTYPKYLAEAAPGSIVDSHFMSNRECTSYAAHKVQERHGYNIYAYGDARNWGTVARSAGKVVTSKPAINTVAVSTKGSTGHVAYVIGVTTSSVTVSEYNGRIPYGYAVSTYPIGHFTEYIKF